MGTWEIRTVVDDLQLDSGDVFLRGLGIWVEKGRDKGSEGSLSLRFCSQGGISPAWRW